MAGARRADCRDWFSEASRERAAQELLVTGAATLAGAENLLARGQAHVALAFCPQVMACCLALIAQ